MLTSGLVFRALASLLVGYIAMAMRPPRASPSREIHGASRDHYAPDEALARRPGGCAAGAHRAALRLDLDVAREEGAGEGEAGAGAEPDPRSVVPEPRVEWSLIMKAHLSRDVADLTLPVRTFLSNSEAQYSRKWIFVGWLSS